MTERGGVPHLTIVQGDIQDLIVNNLADWREDQARAFAPLVDRLVRAGRDWVALSPMGAHFCFAELQAVSAVPLVSAVTPLDDFFSAQDLRRIGLLGTLVVMRTRACGQLRHTEAVAPDDEIELIGQTYQVVAVSGLCLPSQPDLFLRAGRRMVETLGAEAIVLAETDLNLAFDRQTPGYKVIDALDVHVAVLADPATWRGDLAALRSDS